MSTELADAPVDSSANDTVSLEAQFTAAQEAVGIDPAPVEAKPVVEVPAKPAEVRPPIDDGIPDEIISGKKPDEKPPEVEKDFASEEPPKEIKGAAREAFKKLQQAADLKIKTQAQQLAELQKKFAERPADTAPSKEHEEALKAATERAAALEQELEKSDYARSPRFQKFDKDSAVEIAAAKSYIEGTEVAASVIDAASHATGAQRAKLLRESGMDAETIALVSTNLARADAIRRERDESLSNWKAARDQEASEQGAARAAAEQRQRAAENEVFQKVGEKVKTTLEGFRRIDGNEKWNATVEKNEKDAAEFFAGAKTLEELAELAYMGVAARTTQEINAGLRKRLEAANAELASLKAAQPGTGHSVTVKADGKPMSEKEHYESNFNAAKASLAG